MPQGKRIRHLSIAARDRSMNKEPKSKAAPRSSSIAAPKSDRGRSRVNVKYLDKLGKWTNDFEMIAAGKVLASGSRLRMGGLTQDGRAQLKIIRDASKPKDPTRKRNRHVRGMTKYDEVDDVGGKFILESMGIDSSTVEAATARKMKSGAATTHKDHSTFNEKSRRRSFDDDIANAISEAAVEKSDNDTDGDDEQDDEIAADHTETGGSAFAL